jgi:CBS domain-containing protein
MPFIVQELIEENPNVVSARLKEPVQAVLARMIEHDFSQLPIVDDERRPVGMITHESILRALNHFDVGLDKLLVEHARVRAHTFRSDADLFELLDRLQATYAVLIIDGERRLTGIVTNYDTAEYFRRRAEDMMLVEDIETMIKDYILAAYQVDAAQSNREKLDADVLQMTDSGQALRQNFERALIHYLTLQSENKGKVAPNSEWLETVFSKHLNSDRPARQFEDLTLYDYIVLLLDKQKWQKYQSIFAMERDALSNLLDKVRETRNALAHFRRDLSAAQRDHLRFSADWLAQYQDAVIAAFGGIVDADAEEVVDISEAKETEIAPQTDDTEQILPVEDEAEPNESRYAPLAIWLQNQPPKKDLLKPTFAQIEEIIDGELPASAYEHRAWWANDPVGHVQSQQWLDVGWRVASVNMSTQVVRFARIQERQRAYIEFFSPLIDRLIKELGYDHLRNMSDGNSWHWTKSVVVNEQHLGSFNYAFGRGNVLRIELYMDSGNAEINKRLFDLLYEQKAEIEAKLDCELRWQRLNNRRASRISYILPGSITDSEEELAELRDKAVPTMTAFTNVFYPRVLDVGQAALAKRMSETE